MQTTAPHVDEVRKFLSTRKSLNLFRAVSSRYGNTLYDLDDAVQDIAIRCLEQASMFRGGNVEAWACMVATRVLLNEVRKPDYKRAVTEYDERVDARIEPSPPADVIVATEQLSERFAAVLNEDELALCADLARHGGSVADLARERGVNANTLHTRKKRVMDAFASVVGG